jgi:1,4-alpha-glucan branching enzyme
VIEAMAAGLAVITTDTGLAGEVVKNGENGIVVPVGDVRAMSAALAATHRDPAMRSRIADRGRETALGLPPKTKDEYLALYKKSFESCPR